MDRDELLKMFDLKAPLLKAKELRVGVDPALPGGEQTVATVFHDTVLMLDQWDLAQGERLIKQNHHIRSTELSQETIADFHAAMFLLNPEKQTCYDRLREKFLSAILETPEYNALHQSTRGNLVASELAVADLATQYAALRRTEADEKAKRGGQAQAGGPAPHAQEVRCMGAVAQALQQAQEHVEELESAVGALGCGVGQGSNDRINAGTIASIFQRVRNSARLRRICELAGRYRMTAQAKQRHKFTHGYDDMIGIKLTGQVSNVLAIELAKLDDEDYETDTMRRLLENQCLGREYRGMDHVAKGPIIMLVDGSGSMSGEKIANAKALALSMAWIAQKQNRWCCLIEFAGGPEGNILTLPPRKWNQPALLDWLEHFYSGGTTMQCACETLPQTYWPGLLNSGASRGKTDMIILTDGIVHIPSTTAQKFLAWKAQEKVRCISLILAGHAGPMAQISDEVHLMRSVSLEEDGVQNCLSI